MKKNHLTRKNSTYGINIVLSFYHIKTLAGKALAVFTFLFFSLHIQASSPPDTLDLENTHANDSTEYELIIMDPGFNTWFYANSMPKSFYEQSYLESWNERLVIQWNNALMSGGRFNCQPETYLDYDSQIDYGKELNYQLFYYFFYMH
ncbi:MAG: DUF6146 family protein, partial [Bacteroidota bacterium]